MMAEGTLDLRGLPKADAYEQLDQEVRAVLEGVPDPIAAMATMRALTSTSMLQFRAPSMPTISEDSSASFPGFQTLKHDAARRASTRAASGCVLYLSRPAPARQRFLPSRVMQ
jgi:hypothetical protein